MVLLGYSSEGALFDLEVFFTQDFACVHQVQFLSLESHERAVERLQNALDLVVPLLRHLDQLHVVLLEIFSDALGVLERRQHHVVDELLDIVPRAREPAFEDLIVLHDDVIEDLSVLDIVQDQLVVCYLRLHLLVVGARYWSRPQLPTLFDRGLCLLGA